VQDLAFVGRLQLVVWAVGTALTIAFVLAGLGLYSVVLGWVFTQAAGAVGSAVRAWRLVPEVFTWRGGAGMARPTAYLRRSTWIGLSQVAQVFLAGTDMLVVGKLLGPAVVVPYSCTTKLVSVLANHPHLLMHAAAPALSELRAGGSRERLAALTNALTIVMLVASGAIACVVIAGNALFVGWWVGPSQFGGWPLTLAAVLMMLLRHWNTAATYTLFCFGHDRRNSVTMLADGVVTLAGSLLLVHWLGIVGAPLGSLAGVLLVALPMNLSRISRDLDAPVRVIAGGLTPWLVRMLIAGGVAGLLAWHLDGTGFIGLAVGAAAAGATYAAVMAPLLVRPPLGEFMRPAIDTVRRALPFKLLRPAEVAVEESQA
jgi:O-antigen/teichoic acid export membrane protein